MTRYAGLDSSPASPSSPSQDMAPAVADGYRKEWTVIDIKEWDCRNEERTSPKQADRRDMTGK